MSERYKLVGTLASQGLEELQDYTARLAQIFLHHSGGSSIDFESTRIQDFDPDAMEIVIVETIAFRISPPQHVEKSELEAELARRDRLSGRKRGGPARRWRNS
ncbi:MAG: hypothetical protein ACMVO5_00030 [Polymorphobacter sp.]|uniref:hypothetical protein n=1 Tax=Polymorphobacter sp. TaxID=1909290 RepID=UPI003A89F217